MERFKERKSRGVATETHIALLTNLPMHFEISTQTEKIPQIKQLRFDMPEKNGTDVAIQVKEADIFDFDKEAGPIVSVLAQRILEEAEIEALAEDESDFMADRQKALVKEDNLRNSRMRRFEEQQRAYRKAKRKRREDAKKRRETMKEAHSKLLSRYVGKRFVNELKSDVSKKIGVNLLSLEEKARIKVGLAYHSGLEKKVVRLGNERKSLGLVLKKIGDCVMGKLGRLYLEHEAKFKE